MLDEKKVASFRELIRDLNVIDLDAGVRIIGKYKAKRCFVFVTRSATGFTSILCTMKHTGRDTIPDKRILAKDFGGIEDLEKFLSEVAVTPLVAAEY